MYLVQDVGKLVIEYALDEPIPGPHPKCVACHRLLLAEDERIILRREQVRVSGIRAGQFFCALCAKKLTDTINSLLGE